MDETLEMLIMQASVLNKGREAIPEDCKETIDNYVRKGWRPGSFVTACLANDLWGAASCADWSNWRYLSGMAYYITSHVPGHLKGSYDAIGVHCLAMKEQELAEQENE